MFSVPGGPQPSEEDERAPESDRRRPGRRSQRRCGARRRSGVVGRRHHSGVGTPCRCRRWCGDHPIGGRTGPGGAPQAFVDGYALDPDANIVGSPLREGAVVSLHDPAGCVPGEPTGVVEFRVAGGPAAGVVHRLGVGRYDIGSGPAAHLRIDDPELDARAATLSIAMDGTCDVTLHGVEKKRDREKEKEKEKGRRGVSGRGAKGGRRGSRRKGATVVTPGSTGRTSTAVPGPSVPNWPSGTRCWRSTATPLPTPH